MSTPRTASLSLMLLLTACVASNNSAPTAVEVAPPTPTIVEVTPSTSTTAAEHPTDPDRESSVLITHTFWLAEPDKAGGYSQDVELEVPASCAEGGKLLRDRRGWLDKNGVHWLYPYKRGFIHLKIVVLSNGWSWRQWSEGTQVAFAPKDDHIIHPNDLVYLPIGNDRCFVPQSYLSDGHLREDFKSSWSLAEDLQIYPKDFQVDEKGVVVLSAGWTWQAGGYAKVAVRKYLPPGKAWAAWEGIDFMLPATCSKGGVLHPALAFGAVETKVLIYPKCMLADQKLQLHEGWEVALWSIIGHADLMVFVVWPPDDQWELLDELPLEAPR